MSKTAILIDSGCDPTDLLREQPDCYIQPIKFILDGEIYSDGQDSDIELFYSKIKNTKKFYTEPPSMWEILERFEELRDQGYSRIIDIHMSESLSEIYKLSHIAKNYLNGIEIEIIDTQSAATGACLIVLKIIELIKKGKPFNEIEKSMPFIRESSFNQFTVPSIKYLVKNGRIGKAKGFAANLFNLKPVLSIEGGVIVPVAKVKGLENACKLIIDNAISFLSTRPHNVTLSFGYGLQENIVELEKLKTNFMERFETLGIKDHKVLSNMRLRPTLTCHSGPDILTVAVYGEKPPMD